MATEINKPMYGVWLPSKGWLRGKDSQCFADYNKEVAEEVAKRISNNAKVYFIDQSIIDLEAQLLIAEQNKNISLFARIHNVLKVNKQNDKVLGGEDGVH